MSRGEVGRAVVEVRARHGSLAHPPLSREQLPPRAPNSPILRPFQVEALCREQPYDEVLFAAVLKNVGELTLREPIVDFEGGTVRVFRTKTGTGDVLPLHPVLAEELALLRRERKGARPTSPVFLSSRATRWVNVTKSWKNAIKAAELEGRDAITFHSLRHHPASRVIPREAAPAAPVERAVGKCALAVAG